jgi:hypothetical protein
MACLEFCAVEEEEEEEIITAEDDVSTRGFRTKGLVFMMAS